MSVSLLLISSLWLLEEDLGSMATAEKTHMEVRKGLSKLGIANTSQKHLSEHAQDPTQPGNPETKRTDQIFAEEVGRTSMLWSPFLNRGKLFIGFGFEYLSAPSGAQMHVHKLSPDLIVSCGLVSTHECISHAERIDHAIFAVVSSLAAI